MSYPIRLLSIFTACMAVPACCSLGAGTETQSLSSLTNSTEAYQKVILKRLLAEVNSVVCQLSLSEATPIVEKDCDVHIHPPRIAKGMKALGSVSTRKFTYYFSVENKFSFVESAIPITERYRKVRSAYTWPVSRKDTNAALQIATQWLGAIGIDAGALNRACQVEVSAWSPEGPNSPRFVPVYWVTWRETNSLAAFVELIVPTRTLYQLRIEKGKYIMRSPVVTDAEQQKWAN